MDRGFAASAPGTDTNQVQAGSLNAQAEKVSEASALYALAVNQDAAGDHAGALAALRQVVTMNPSFAEAQVRLAQMLLAAKQPDEAYAQLQTAKAAQPDPAVFDAVTAQVEAARGHPDVARTLARQALARDPTSGDAMRVLLDLGLAEKDLEAAVSRVTQHLEAAHAPVDSYLALVKLYIDYTGGETPAPDGNVVLRTLLGIYEVAVKVAPRNIDLLSVMSDTQSQLGQSAAALATLQRAQALDPQNVDLIMRCASLAHDAGDSTQQQSEYDKAFAIDPQRVRSSLATTFFESQQYDKALEVMKKMLETTPNDSMLLIRIGVTCEALHQDKEAHDWYEKSLHSPALSLEAAQKLATYFIDQQRTAEAAEAIEIGIKRFPSSPELRFYSAVQNLNSGNAAAALDDYNRARDLAGGDPSALGVNYYLEGAMILAAAGHHGEVEPLVRQGLEKFPDDPNLLNQLAWEWADQGHNLNEALTTAQKAVALTPDNGSMQDTLGYVYLKLNRPKDALPVLQQAANLTKNDPSVCQHLGDAYLAGGRRADALSAWRLGLKKNPNDRELIQRIATHETSSEHVSLSPAPP